ncbi:MULTISPECIES: sigma-70 family RNA polymerase sigma factor [Clostridium]|uniref:sigma-70 family RNA polymerase sigma factor n=1 Tax=Clostridium TaxID=1485 RepID=UPI00082502F9|nr:MULTISPECIES: sigma-70 family RNA polymerase sigma factor [Clostridium]PJI10542.1 sigma-70 family RNA polymerase sigma factor [Clostridium sp. CT7]
MSYHYNTNLNSLVLKAKSGNKESLCEILNSFKPFIKNFCKNIYIKNFDLIDLYEECCLSIILSVKKCDIKKFNFTAYTICSIKNNIFYKIRTYSKSNKEMSLDNKVSFDEDFTFLDILKDNSNSFSSLSLHFAVNSLTATERDLIKNIFFLGYSSLEYSKQSEINYRTCLRRRKKALKKLKNKLINKDG